MVHRTATSESESGVESNWGTSVTHDDDVTCDGNSEGHSVFDGGDETADTGIEDGTNVSQRSMSVVTLGDDTLLEDMGLDSDTTLDCSDGDEDPELADDADDSRKTHCSGNKSSGDESNALDPSFMYTSKIYVTLSGSDQSDLSMQEAVSVNSDSERQSVTRQTSLFDELKQADDRLSLKVNILEGDAGGSGCVDAETDESSRGETTLLEVCGLIKDEGDGDAMCWQEDSDTVINESDPSGGLATVPQYEESKKDGPENADECPELLDRERISCDEVSMKIGSEDEECEEQRDEPRALGDHGSFDVPIDLSYEDSFEDSVRDNDTEYCCAASSELSESETTGVYNVAAYPECTGSTVDDEHHRVDELRLDLAKDIMTDQGSVASDDPSDWMEASVNSLIASANRDWVQQNVLSESAQSRNEEFAALQKALMMRTIQCVVSEQLSRGSASSDDKPDDQAGYVSSNDDVSRKLTGSDELLHLLDMIGVQGQEMRKELVMSQSREAYLQEEMTNDDEQLIEVVDVLQQELSVVKEDNLRLHDELMENEVVRSEYVQEVGSLKGVVRRLCGHIEHLEVEVKKMHSDMMPRQVTKNASTLTDAPCRFNFAMQTECDGQSAAKVTVRNADCQMVSHVETVDGCCQTERESGLVDDTCQNDSAERMSNNVTTMIDKILQQMAHMTGRSISATTTYSDEADGDYVWQANDECDSSEATVQVMKQHLANAMLQYDLTKSELERRNDALQQEVESSSSRLCDTERELTKAREQNDLLKVLTEGDKAEMDILKDKIAMMDKAVSAAQIVNDRLTLRLDATLNEVSMMTPAQEAELKDKMAALEADKKQLGQVRQNVSVHNMIFCFISPVALPIM